MIKLTETRGEGDEKMEKTSSDFFLHPRPFNKFLNFFRCEWHFMNDKKI